MCYMAKTNRDMQLKARIQFLINQFPDKPDKEIIYLIAGNCGVTHRTASEHYHTFKAQKNLKDMGFLEECKHDWSSYFSTPGGLARECKLCGKTEFAKIE